MSHTPHELADEFPNDHAVLHDLKLKNAHFVTLSERYHDLNGEIHRIEAGIETPSDGYTGKIKKKRVAPIDENSGMVATARQG